MLISLCLQGATWWKLLALPSSKGKLLEVADWFSHCRAAALVPVYNNSKILRGGSSQRPVWPGVDAATNFRSFFSLGPMQTGVVGGGRAARSADDDGTLQKINSWRKDSDRSFSTHKCHISQVKSPGCGFPSVATSPRRPLTSGWVGGRPAGRAEAPTRSIF